MEPSPPPTAASTIATPGLANLAPNTHRLMPASTMAAPVMDARSKATFGAWSVMKKLNLVEDRGDIGHGTAYLRNLFPVFYT